MTSPIVLTVGIGEVHRRRAAELIDEAFRTKLACAIPDEWQRLEVLANGLDLASVIGAFEGDVLVGVLGFKAKSQAVFEGITFRALREELGVGAIRAALFLYLLDNPADPETFRIELIAVDGATRGRGIGGKLLAAADDLACALGMAKVELDVVDTNPDAHRLYLRRGFEDERIDRLPIPASWMGFQESTTMVKAIACDSLR